MWNRTTFRIIRKQIKLAQRQLDKAWTEYYPKHGLFEAQESLDKLLSFQEQYWCSRSRSSTSINTQISGRKKLNQKHKRQMGNSIGK